MTDMESRKAFEAWCERTGHFSLANNDWARIAWSARDAEIAALKARVEELEESLVRAIEAGEGGEQHE